MVSDPAHTTIIDCIDYVTGIGNVIQAPPHSLLRANTFSVGQQTGMAIHRVSSSSRVWFEFELTFELAHARSILFAGSCMLGIELPKLQLPNWYHGKLPGKCQTGALG